MPYDFEKCSMFPCGVFNLSVMVNNGNMLEFEHFISTGFNIPTYARATSVPFLLNI